MKEGSLHIIRTLTSAGFLAYYAGGYVRDMLLGIVSDDIDIATTALPDEIRKLFPHTISVGAHFGVVIVVVDNHHYEVATFRSEGGYTDGRRPGHINPATPQEDSQRRDFTINGMFYDPLHEQVYDYVGGQEDLKRGLIRAIGDPYQRFAEDRLRMIRAVRFACRFGYEIEADTYAAIRSCAHTLLPAVSMERIWQESAKMVCDGHFDTAVAMMYDLTLLQTIFPVLAARTYSDICASVRGMGGCSQGIPPILAIARLFSHLPLSVVRSECRRLKVSNKEIDLVECFYRLRSLVDDIDTPPVEWARFYASDYAEECILVLTSGYDDCMRKNALDEHHKRQQLLASSIQRIKDGRPLITASMLKKQGVLPGKRMGELIHEAEVIAVNKGLNNADDVLYFLKQSPYWFPE